jgi:hypothetical protein
MQVIKPPTPLNSTGQNYGDSLFLAGSIEMGQAVDWQSQLISALDGLTGTIFNPRRDDWDASWEQKIENAQFREQVEWELRALELAECIVLYLDPNTKSPISLLELGIWTRQPSKLVVCCPEGFWRKGNVDIVCRKYGIAQVATLDELILDTVRTFDSSLKCGHV